MCILVEFFNRHHRFDTLRHYLYHKWAKIAYLVLFVGWWIVRNIV